MSETQKNYKTFYCGIATLIAATAFAVTANVQSISADTVTDSPTTTTTFVPSDFENSPFLSSTLGESKIQVSEGGSATYGKWVYQYTAGPYALFKNSETGAWKYTQIISTTQYTVTVMFDGWARTFHL